MRYDLDFVNGFMLDHARGRVLLINKSKPDWQRGKLNGVGGKVGDVDPLETPYDAMVREFREETGLDSEPGMWDLFCVLSGHVDGDPRLGRFRVHFFRASRRMLCFWLPTRTEDEVPEWVPISDVLSGKRPAIPNLRWLIPMAFISSQHDWPYKVEEKCHADC